MSSILPGRKSRLIVLCGSDLQLEPQNTELLSQEEQFEEVLNEYQLKCRVRAPSSPSPSEP